MKTVKQLRQERENDEVMVMYNIAVDEVRLNKIIASKRLRTCNARVHETENFYVLESYNTCVAVIPKGGYYGHDCYDALRMVYGYTSTSVQHIAKFHNDYAYGNARYTYR